MSGYVYLRMSAEVNGETVEARHSVRSDVWEIEYCRDQIKGNMRDALAAQILKVIDVTFEEIQK